VSLLIHAITRAPASPPALAGLRGAPLVVASSADLCACATDLPDRPTLSREDLYAHHAIVEAIWRQSACLPARLPTWVDSVQALESLLTVRAEGLAHSLALVEGQAELALTLLWTDTPSSDLPAEPPAQTPGRAYLQTRRREVRAEEQLRERAEALAATLEHGLASRSRIALLPSDSVALSLALLTPREAASNLQAALEKRLTEHPDVHPIWNGPWPPYSFADAA